MKRIPTLPVASGCADADGLSLLRMVVEAPGPRGPASRPPGGGPSILMSKGPGRRELDPGPNFDLHTRRAGAGAQRLTGGKDGARLGAGGRSVPTPRFTPGDRE